MAAVNDDDQAVAWIQITVRDRCGAYVTPTVRGQRASCTHSAQAASQRLADKLWSGEPALRFVEYAGAGASVWRIAPSLGALD